MGGSNNDLAGARCSLGLSSKVPMTELTEPHIEWVVGLDDTMAK